MADTPAEHADASARQVEATACDTCGTTTSDPSSVLLSWTRSLERGLVVWTCGDCSRRHARSIEARLDSQWW